MMMQLYTHHWHVAVTSPEDCQGCQDQSFEDVDSAVDYANETRDTLAGEGHTMTEVDRPDDDVSGVIQRYQATEEEEDATPALVEVRPCHQAGCLPEGAHDRLRAVDGTLPPPAGNHPIHMLNVGGANRPTRSFRLVAGPLG
jgi:hypothetical protein